MKVVFPLKNVKEEHIGVMQLASVLRRDGWPVEVVQAEEKTVLQRIANDKQTVLAFSAPTVYYRYYRDLNLRIKQEMGERFTLLSADLTPHLIHLSSTKS